LYPLKPGVSRGPPGLSGARPPRPPRNSTTGKEGRKEGKKEETGRQEKVGMGKLEEGKQKWELCRLVKFVYMACIMCSPMQTEIGRLKFRPNLL